MFTTFSIAAARITLRFAAALLGACVGLTAVPAVAATPSAQVQTTWRLLDYVAVDYSGAVRGGRVVNQSEYREMAEFADSVTQRLAALPANPAKARLSADAAALRGAVAAKADADDIKRRAGSLAAALLAAYPVPRAPSAMPDLARGAALFAANCASCHGAQGEGPAGAAARLDPAPIAFADRSRARNRSLFGLYQVISQGLEGTAMQSFAAMPDEDRWALAFHVGGLAFAEREAGKRAWHEDAALRSSVPDLAALVALKPADLEQRIGAEKAAAVTAFLRSNPAALTGSSPTSLQLVRDRLAQSLSASAVGNREQAQELALSAYLDGFEPVEPALATRDAGLKNRIEAAMAGFRAATGRGQPHTELESRAAAIGQMLTDAEAALAPESADRGSTFFGALIILLREGLEALLVVIAMIAFLRKAERTEALPYVHGGWVAALLAGGATWAIATYAIGISGASRELTEGFGSLLAAVVLLSVGVWMHGKSQAEEWRRYIHAKMQGALSRGSAWFLFGLAFVVVYREVFETVLFYAALWTPDNGLTILAGALSAAVLLGLIAWGMLRYSRTLPVTQFFAYSAILIAVLAVVLAGKGVAALQESGMLPVTPLEWMPRITILGLFPAAEPIAAQLATLAAVLFGFRSNRRPRTATPLAA